MGSKVFILLGLLLAIVLLISSEVAARDLAEASTEGKVDAKDVDQSGGEYPGSEYPGGELPGGVYPGGGDQYGGGYPGGGYPGGGYGGGGRGGYGRGGGGRGGYGGGGRGGYGRGRGGCYYGCCRSNYYGRGCSRCCRYAGEAVEKQTQDKPHN